MLKTILLTCAVSICGLQTALADCPTAPDHTSALSQLSEKARAAPNETQGREISNKMWELWVDAPNEQAQAILDRGMQKRSSYDLLGAIEDFTALIGYCPEYAEGYNQRAFALFLQENFTGALPDLDRALELSPNHVAARSGRALTHMQLGDVAKARTDLMAALEDNPWISERHLLANGAPLAAPGDDI
ncbi:MAG: tetratricopeptide repeat protein [Aliishimia sp.]